MKRFLAFLLLIFSVSCTGRPASNRVVIVSTNDIHSSIDNFPRLATLVEGLRTAEGADHVLLVDAGDRWTGNPFVDIAERPLSPVIELMNELGYDLATLGNHEFDWGQSLLRERLDECAFPVICANVAAGPESELGYVPPYAIVEIGGMSLGVVGLVTNFNQFNRPEGKAEHFDGLTFPDAYRSAGQYTWLADSCDLFVGLTHLGHRNDLTLAQRIPSLDLIIGGDSHTVVEEPVTVGQTLVTQAGSKLAYAGITTITRTGEGFEIDNRLVKLDTITASAHYTRLVERINNNPALLSPIGETAAGFSKRAVQYYAVDAIRAAMRADVALYHGGGLRVDTLAGPISVADLYRIEPFISEIYTVSMTPGQLKGLLLGTFNGNDPKTSHKTDLVPSGLRYTFTTDVSGDATDVVLSLPAKDLYLVAIPDYLYKNYPALDPALGAIETGRLVTDILREQITSGGPIEPDNETRAEIK